METIVSKAMNRRAFKMTGKESKKKTFLRGKSFGHHDLQRTYLFDLYMSVSEPYKRTE